MDSTNYNEAIKRLAIAGGGQGAAMVVSSLIAFSTVKICGITDLNKNAPGILESKENDIPVFADINSMLNDSGAELIFDLTGSTAARREINKHLRKGQELVPGNVVELIFDLLHTMEANTFLEQLQNRRKLVREGISQGLFKLLKVVGELEDIANEAGSKTQAISSEASNVSIAADSMSLHMASIATSATQARNNVSSIAQTTEEMTNTISEIASNAERARMVTRLAVESADGASSQVSELGLCAKEISKVTETIADIADQTKLLALNATIEAARAGEAGKGFAVVASEVKELAKQTNTATTDIRMKIDAIQSATSETINEIGKINKVITDVNEIVTIIASAVEEQSIATREMARTTVDVATGIDGMTKNVEGLADTSKVVATNIGDVHQNLESLDAIAKKLKTSAKSVEQTGEELNALASNGQNDN